MQPLFPKHVWALLAVYFAASLAHFVACTFGLRAVAALLVAAYGAFGLDGLGHYTLALCSEHTLVTNATIGFEAAAGLVLALSAALAAIKPLL